MPVVSVLCLTDDERQVGKDAYSPTWVHPEHVELWAAACELTSKYQHQEL